MRKTLRNKDIEQVEDPCRLMIFGIGVCFPGSVSQQTGSWSSRQPYGGATEPIAISIHWECIHDERQAIEWEKKARHEGSRMSTSLERINKK